GLAERLKHLLREANGLGLAATQIGVLRRVFAFLPDPEGEPVVIVNPTFTATSEERESDTEGCLSLQGVVIPVERAVSLTVEGKDPEGNDVRLELDALPARIAQHELDHLDGVLILHPPTARGRRGARAARARPPGRRADPRPHARRGAARGPRDAAASARRRPLVPLPAMAARL